MKTTALSIEKLMTPLIGSPYLARHQFQCDQTGRLFDIRRYEEGFFLDEQSPNCLWDSFEKRIAFKEIYLYFQGTSTPNNFRSALLSNASINDSNEARYKIIRGGASGRSELIYLDSLAACAAAISQALNNDEYYVSTLPYVPPSKEDQINEIKRSIESVYKQISEREVLLQSLLDSLDVLTRPENTRLTLIIDNAGDRTDN